MSFETEVNFDVKFDVVVLLVRDDTGKYRRIIYVLSDYYKKYKKLFNKCGCTEEIKYKDCNFVNVDGHIDVIRMKDRSYITMGKSLFGKKVVSCCKLKKKEIIC